ncbi:MAG: glycosyltransferase [Anaerolineales bacterium]|nr:glycosyltransferase [Anaerolineales bacterium]
MTTEKTILLCTIGSAGDVYPFIGIGQQLKKRGFRVVLVTSQYFEAHARSAGLEFIGLGSAEDYQSIIQDPDLWSAEKGFKVFAERVVFPIMEPAYEIIAGFDPSQTILVAQGQFFAAHIAHEKLGFPFITIHLQPAAFRSVHEFPLLPAWIPPLLKRGIFNLIDVLVLDKLFAPNINRLRQRLSLPAINKIFGNWMHSPQKNLGLFPEWFAHPQPDWPPQTQLTGFIYHDNQDGDEELPKELETFLSAGSAPIIFTAGTAMKHGSQFFLDCIEACQRLGRRGILLTQHPEQLPAQLPQGIQHFAYLPFSRILPRAAALVHHGGIGTTAQAIAAGIPQVIRPMTHDQPDNAARVEKLGISASLSPKKFNAASLAEKLNAVISSQQVLDRCKFYAQKINPDQALNDACAIIADFARNQS